MYSYHNIYITKQTGKHRIPQFQDEWQHNPVAKQQIPAVAWISLQTHLQVHPTPNGKYQPGSVDT